jgi:hypothetical protein
MDTCDIIDIPPTVLPSFLNYLNDFIQKNEKFYENFIDRKANEVIIYEHNKQDYTVVTFKDDTLTLLIPHVYRYFTHKT